MLRHSLKLDMSLQMESVQTGISQLLNPQRKCLIHAPFHITDSAIIRSLQERGVSSRRWNLVVVAAYGQIKTWQ